MIWWLKLTRRKHLIKMNEQLTLNADLSIISYPIYLYIYVHYFDFLFFFNILSGQFENPLLPVEKLDKKE